MEDVFSISALSSMTACALFRVSWQQELVSTAEKTRNANYCVANASAKGLTKRCSEPLTGALTRSQNGYEVRPRKDECRGL
jgi:hypothetical protein